MDQPMRAADFKASSTFEPFPAVRFERKEPTNSRFEAFNEFTDTFAFKKKSREDVSKLAFAQFSAHQVPPPDFDPAYPSALHTTKDEVWYDKYRLPYLLLDQTEDDFKKIVLESLVMLFIKAVDITKDGEKYGASKVPGRKTKAHDTPLEAFMGIIDKGVEFPFLSRVSKTERGVDSSGADHVKINNDQLVNEYIKLFPGEARLVYCAAKWPQLAKHWFEVYRHPQITSTLTRSNTDETIPVDEPIPTSGVVAYEIGFNRNFKCITVDETDHSKTCNALHLGSKVYTNVVECQVCTSVSEIICISRNRCGIPEWLDSWTPKKNPHLILGQGSQHLANRIKRVQHQ
ncbi:hypothetical protein T484DRAFT_1758311 [Baffinella frigidus]|nr:hypothetical protein T484DRAFT_1758311 [Cryptophyta sp. CCMP2293]